MPNHNTDYTAGPRETLTLYAISGTAGFVGLVLVITMATVACVVCRKYRKQDDR